MRVLVACEESQVVTKAFRARGHLAWSCDVSPCSGGRPEWHIERSMVGIMHESWDMILAFPPCTHLASSGARWFKTKQKDGRQQYAIKFFLGIANHHCKRLAIENPIGIMSTKFRKPDQIIQPWQFGHPENKRTCLWLKGLPLLEPTSDLRDEMKGMSKAETDRIHYMAPSADRAKLRSKTYQGVADAMAEQWG